jgi:hypothetical protein
MKLDITKKIEDKIKDISPKPKWNFVLKDYLLWGVGLISIVVGALAFSVVIYMILNSGWDIYHQIGESLFGFVMVAMPYFWILILLLFIALAYFEIKHTKRGYRFKLSHIVLSSVILSVVLGGLLYNIGMGEAMDDVFAENIPIYRKHLSRHRDFLNKPDRGVIAGVVLDIDDSTIKLKSFSGQIWEVDYPPHLSFRPLLGSKVWVVGEKTATSSFEVKMIKPFGGQKQGRFVPPRLFERK